MKKKLAVLLAGALCVTSFTVGVLSNEIVKNIDAEIRGDFEVVIDGKKETFKNAQGEVVYPILYDGTTYLPVRAIGEIMGKTVYWYQNEKRIELLEPAENTLVTDADVIVDGTEKTTIDKIKTSKVDKGTEKEVKKNEVLSENIKITAEEAKAIALEKAGLTESEVVFIKAELDRDDRNYEYDVDFRYGFTEYEAEISAIDGTIKTWEVDRD